MFRVASKRDGRGHLTPFYSTADAGLIRNPNVKPAYPATLSSNSILTSQSAWYLFNENASPVKDIVNGNAATLASGITWTSVSGNTRLAFNGAGGAFLTLPADNAFLATNALSVFTEFNCPDVQTQRGIVSTWFNQWLIQVYQGNFLFLLKSPGGAANAQLSVPISPNVNYKLAAIYDGTSGTMTIYLNGVATSGTLTGAIPSSLNQSISSSYPPQIGTKGDNTSAVFSGTLDQVRVWKRALSSSEVAALQMDSYLGT